METPDIIALIVVAFVGFSLWKTNRDPASSINVFDLVLEGGKLSKLACAFWASFGVMTWVMIKVTQAGKMESGYLLAYGGAFVAPIIAKMFSLPPPPIPDGTTTKLTSEIVETKTEPAKVDPKRKGK